MGHAKTSTLEGQNLVRRRDGADAVGPIVAQRTTKVSARMATPTSAAMSSSSARDRPGELAAVGWFRTVIETWTACYDVTLQYL